MHTCPHASKALRTLLRTLLRSDASFFFPISPSSAEFRRIQLDAAQFRGIRPNQANSGQFSPIPPNSAESSRIRPNQANSTQMDPIQPNSAEQGRIRQFRPNSTQFICGFALTSIIHSNQSLLYTCPIFETSAPALRGTTGNLDLFDYCRRAQTVRSKRPPKCSNNSPSENKKGAYCTLPRFDSTKR